MKILIVKTSSLGDIIHTFPVIDYLKQKFPDAEIDWVVERSCISLVQAHPHVNRVLQIDTKFWRYKLFGSRSEILAFKNKLFENHYDLLLDLQGNVKSGIITFLARAKAKVGFGKKTVAEWPNTLATHYKFDPPPGRNIREDYLYIAQSYYKDNQPFTPSPVQLKSPDVKNQFSPPCYMVCPGSAWVNKQLTTHTLSQFLRLVHQRTNCLFLFVWGTEEERIMLNQLVKEHSGYCHIIERHTIPELQNLMSQMDLVIAMDSLPLHLAGTTKTPTFSIFGPSLATKYQPIGKQHISFQASCPYGKTFEKRCPVLRTCPTGACMHELNAQQLFERFCQSQCAAQQVLSPNQP